MIICDVPAPVIELGLKLTVVPAGWPLATSPMGELNPSATMVVTAAVPLPSGDTLTDPGQAYTAKDGSGGGAEGEYSQRSLR